jgi:hypothetical protein
MAAMLCGTIKNSRKKGAGSNTIVTLHIDRLLAEPGDFSFSKYAPPVMRPESASAQDHMDRRRIEGYPL